MAQEQSPVDPATQSSGPESPVDSDARSSGFADFGVLVRQYGEAMVRIGHLESQVDSLNKQFQSEVTRSGQGASVVDSPVVSKLLEKIKSLHKLETESSEKSAMSSSEGGPGQSSVKEPRKNDELRQMRVQLINLASQLSQAQGELKEVQGRQSRHRRHRNEKRRLWQNLARRLGLANRRIK